MGRQTCYFVSPKCSIGQSYQTLFEIVIMFKIPNMESYPKTILNSRCEGSMQIYDKMTTLLLFAKFVMSPFYLFFSLHFSFSQISSTWVYISE